MTGILFSVMRYNNHQPQAGVFLFGKDGCFRTSVHPLCSFPGSSTNSDAKNFSGRMPTDFFTEYFYVGQIGRKTAELRRQKPQLRCNTVRQTDASPNPPERNDNLLRPKRPALFLFFFEYCFIFFRYGKRFSEYFGSSAIYRRIKYIYRRNAGAKYRIAVRF